ncbi:MAG: helix-turn-helix domain-containing protein [Adlercreutzia equolifaciens]
MVPLKGGQWFAAYGDLMTVSDVAEVLRQSGQTVRRLMASGRIPAVKIGSRWYTPKSRLVEFVEEGVDGAA